jgi:hypothetical protein
MIRKFDTFSIVLFLVVVFIISAVLFYFVDSTNLDTVQHEAKVVKTYHSPGFMQTTTTVIDGTPLTTSTYIPDVWSAKVMTLNIGRVTCTIDEYVYYGLRNGEEVIAHVATGRFSGSNYCKGLIVKE